MSKSIPFLSAGAALFAAALAIPAAAGPVGLPGNAQTTTATLSPLQTKLAAGNEAINRKDLDAAQVAFSEAAKLDAKAPGPLLGLAEVARLRHNKAETEKWLQRAVEVAPESADVQQAWGRYQFTQRNFTLAESALKKAAALAPDLASIQFDLGDLYLNWLHRPKEAAAAYREAIRLQPDQGSAHLGLAMALASLGKTSEAAQEFERSATLFPGNPLPLTALGRLYASTGDLDRARAAFDRALAARADFEPALVDRGDVFMLRKDPERAAADYEKAVKLAPKNAMTQYKLGAAYQMLGKLDAAEKQYRAAIGLDEKLAAAYNNLASLSAERKHNLDAALDWANRAVALQPDMAAFQDTLGSVRLARGEVDPAIAAFRKAAASTPKDANFYYGLGQALAQKGNKREAVEAFRTALSVNPGFAHSAEARKRIEELGSN